MTDFSHDDFTFWFALKTAALADDWGLVQAMLDEQPPRPVTRHALTIPVLSAAIAKGQGDIARAMLSRGFAPVRADVSTVLQGMSSVDKTQVKPAVDALRHLVDVFPATVISHEAEERWKGGYASEELAWLSQAGADITLQGRAIDLVLAQDEPALMQVLLEEGVSPFSARIVREMSARAPQDALRVVWEEIILSHPDARAAGAVFQRLRTDATVWRAAMFMNPVGYDKTGAAVTLLGVLAALGRGGEVFDASRWHTNRQEAFAVHGALSAYGMRHAVSLAAFSAEMNRTTMRGKDAGRRGPHFKI